MSACSRILNKGDHGGREKESLRGRKNRGPPRQFFLNRLGLHRERKGGKTLSLARDSNTDVKRVEKRGGVIIKRVRLRQKGSFDE